jgi:CRISPR-associated protein Cas2
MFTVVSYDIVEDKRRNRLAKALKGFGYRVQKSVFECQLDDGQFLKMKKVVEKLIDREEDSVRYYFLCGRCRGNIEVSGQGIIREEESVVVV